VWLEMRMRQSLPLDSFNHERRFMGTN
jgi:hypothetical protein